MSLFGSDLQIEVGKQYINMQRKIINIIDKIDNNYVGMDSNGKFSKYTKNGKYINVDNIFFKSDITLDLIADGIMVKVPWVRKDESVLRIEAGKTYETSAGVKYKIGVIEEYGDYPYLGINVNDSIVICLYFTKGIPLPTRVRFKANGESICNNYQLIREVPIESVEMETKSSTLQLEKRSKFASPDLLFRELTEKVESTHESHMKSILDLIESQDIVPVLDYLQVEYTSELKNAVGSYYDFLQELSYEEDRNKVDVIRKVLSSMDKVVEGFHYRYVFDGFGTTMEHKSILKFRINRTKI